MPVSEKEKYDKKIYETLSRAFSNLKDIIENPNRKYTMNKTELPDMTVYYKSTAEDIGC